ncbi:hypothetical protein [Haladaptatus sp. DYF46]|uniref:hypothetical protein n=1 Tax=Haladaptatus sp. DYF46 TaxID=2886041 RepID=UPI001E4ED8CC|nr:hypothetical protein [Haladaptatus sp. DYF46]
MNQRFHISVVTILMVILSMTSGCLSLDPTVTLDTADSTVFKSTSTTDTVAVGKVDTRVMLTNEATTSEGVTQLNVIDATGKAVYKTPVESGETTVTLMLPTTGTVTVVAVNTVNGTVVETQNATITGDSVI